MSVCSVTPEKELGGECETADDGHPGREAVANTDQCNTKQEGELTSQTKPQSAPVNYLKRARARKMARLEEERKLNLMREKCPTHPKSTDKDRADEENEGLISDCFCGECAPSGAFNADTDSS